MTAKSTDNGGSMGTLHRIQQYVPGIVFVLIMLLVAGCTGAVDEPPAGSTISGEGTIVFVPEKGGFFGIIDDNGNRFYPANLENRYMVHGQRVAFYAEIRGNMLPVQQWGIPVEIIEIEFVFPEEVKTGVNRTEMDEFPVFGKVWYIQENGGFYGIISDDGIRYYPSNLPDKLAKDGLPVILEAKRGEQPSNGATGWISITIIDIAEV